MKNFNLYQLIESSAAAALTMQGPDGSMPPGHNGPYHDPETPVRNTAHWLITFLKAWDISGKKQFLDVAHKAIAYLQSDVARPMGASFWHRKNPKKDSCNGLIGQAWTIEALTVGAEKLDLAELIGLAEEVFLLHPFDEKAGLWQGVAVDGMHLPFDLTFNHQLWYAACGGLLAPHANQEVNRRVMRFLDRLAVTLDVYASGLIVHTLTLRSSRGQRVRNLVGGLANLMRLRQHWAYRKYLAYKSVGYHAFNLYALALLRQQYPGHSFWQGHKSRGVWDYACLEAFWQGLEDNEFGYPYNPPGFEMAFALEVFDGNARPQQERWLSEQFWRCYDFEAHMMSRGTKDPVTHAARLYEATRLPDLAVQIED